MPNKTEWTRQLAVEKILRKAGGLDGGHGFHPSREIFARQADAVARLRELVCSGDYSSAQLGVFAQEIGEGGIRQFMVDTFAGFALNNAPEFNPHVFGGQERDVQKGRHDHMTHNTGLSRGSTADRGSLNHLYEVILQDRPCWLYFDLEYSRVSNPDLDPEAAMAAFRETLFCFFRDSLGMAVDLSGLLVLDSSTSEKFSKHVIVQRFGGVHHPGQDARDCGTSDDAPHCLAFANNAQAGLLVSEFVSYARSRGSDAPPSAHLLFVRAPPSLARDPGGPIPLIDESVYSRNRCFRLLFHKKFGKHATLQISRDSINAAFRRREYPPLQLLRTMVSFVRDDIPFFRHEMIPDNFGHSDFTGIHVTNPMKGPAAGGACGGQSKHSSIALSPGVAQFLIETWDSVRQCNEPQPVVGSAAKPTTVSSAVQMDDRFLAVTLRNNRFCFCKGSSHLSNNVYMVVDRDNNRFHQKCFDVDCRHFRSPEFAIPSWMLESESDDETEILNSLPTHLSSRSTSDCRSDPNPIDEHRNASVHLNASRHTEELPCPKRRCLSSTSTADEHLQPLSLLAHQQSTSQHTVTSRIDGAILA